MEETLKQDNKSKAYQEFELGLTQDLQQRKLVENTIITGTVSSVTDKNLFIDLRAKAEGILPLEELKLLKESYKVGDKIQVLLEKLENFSGAVVISREKAKRAKAWKEMEAAYKQNKTVNGMIISRCKGGFIAEINSCLTFLPGSQVDLKPLKNFDHLMRCELKFEIVKMDNKRGNIVVSRRSVLEAARNKDKDKIIATIKEGSVVEGVVKNITQWGVFVDLNGIDSLLHVTDLSWSRVESPSQLVSIGEKIKVLVTKIDKITKKVSVSVKDLSPDPYETLINNFEIGKIYDGVCEKITDYGVFIRIAPGLSGLCHSSELSHTKRNVHPSKILSTSQKVKVKLLEKDLEKRRLSLSFKAAMTNPWKKFQTEHKVGDVLTGSLVSKTDYALFVLIDNTELTCMIHRNDIEWQKDPDLEKFKKQQKITMKIVEINAEDGKIRGSIRAITKNPFDFFMNKQEGETISCVVTNTNPSGISVKAGEGNFQIFIKKNQLSKEISNQRVERFIKNDVHDFLITELDKKNFKVSVSIKALEEKIEAENLKKYKVRDSGGVLGDILSPILKKNKIKK